MIQWLLYSHYKEQQVNVDGIGTIPLLPAARLPRLHRADPSASLDKNFVGWKCSRGKGELSKMVWSLWRDIRLPLVGCVLVFAR